MKPIAIFLSLFAIPLSAQNAFYDAQLLKTKMSEVNDLINLDAEAKAYLAPYFKKADPELITIALLNENPFFNGLFQIDTLGSRDIAPAPEKVKSIGGIRVTRLVNALADVMIERAKQELTVAFFNRFISYAKQHEEFQVLFPRSYDNLSNLLGFQYAQMLPALRSGFFEDAEQITYHLDDVFELPKYHELVTRFPEVKVAVRSLGLVHQLETRESNAADLLYHFAAFDEWDFDAGPRFKNVGTTVKFASIFSENLRSKATNMIWVSPDAVVALTGDELGAKLFTGLVYQLVRNAKLAYHFQSNAVTTPDSLHELMAQQKDNILLFQNKISEFIRLADRVSNTYISLKAMLDKNLPVTHDQVFNYINTSLDIVDYAFGMVQVFDRRLISSDYITIVRNANLLYRDIANQHYSQAMDDALDIVQAVNSLVKENHSASGAVKDSLSKLELFAKQVRPYALFMGNVIEAQTEEELAAVLDNAILPVGSSSIKKHAANDLAIQGYLGAYNAVGKQSAAEGTWSDRFGVTAPIGLAWTPGFLSWQNAGALSIFGSLLDIGAVVDYKLKTEPNNNTSDPNDEVIKKDYEIQLGQIFSPGIFLVYGVGANLPLAFGLGAQYGPGLSKIERDNTLISNNPSWRYNFSLTVDLPFFTLSHQPK